MALSQAVDALHRDERAVGLPAAITTGSSIVPVPLIEAIHARGVPVIQVYGSTETAPISRARAIHSFKRASVVTVS